MHFALQGTRRWEILSNKRQPQGHPIDRRINAIDSQFVVQIGKILRQTEVGDGYSGDVKLMLERSGTDSGQPVERWSDPPA